MSQLLYKDIIAEIASILAHNGETRSLSLLGIAKKLGSKITKPQFLIIRLRYKLLTELNSAVFFEMYNTESYNNV